jgi:methyltransferase
MTARGAVPALGLALFILLLAVERISELFLSRYNMRLLRERGAEEYGRAHYPWFVALHVLFPLALVAEVLAAGARPGQLWGLWLGVFLVAQGLRFAVIRTLGVFWTVRVLVVPGMTPIRRGPYRWLRHPNYLAVALEFFSGAQLFGAWRTAIAATAIYLVLIRLRIPVEERALREAAGTSA